MNDQDNVPPLGSPFPFIDGLNVKTVTIEVHGHSVSYAPGTLRLVGRKPCEGGYVFSFERVYEDRFFSKGSLLPLETIDPRGDE
jgi:hypothetical protein